jgi:hypothetical protein
MNDFSKLTVSPSSGPHHNPDIFLDAAALAALLAVYLAALFVVLYPANNAFRRHALLPGACHEAAVTSAQAQTAPEVQQK